MKTVLITGNTYPVREQLKAIGGRWVPNKKAWSVPVEKESEAKTLVANATTATTATKHKPNRCKVCGAVASINSRGYSNIKIYRSGECQDCYEERKMGY